MALFRNDDDTEHEKPVRQNQLKALFERFKQSQEAEKYDDNIDINNIDPKSKALAFLKDSYVARDETDEMMFILEQMNDLGERTESIISSMVPNVGPKASRFQPDKKEKEKQKMGKAGLLSKISSVIGLGLGSAAIFGGFKLAEKDLIPDFIMDMLTDQAEVEQRIVDKNQEQLEDEDTEAEMTQEDNSPVATEVDTNEAAPDIENTPEPDAITNEGMALEPDVNDENLTQEERQEVIDKKEKEIDAAGENPFGLDNKAVGFLESLKTGASTVTDILNKVVSRFSLGAIPSLPFLLFNAGKDSALVDFFASKLKKYSAYLYEIMTQVTSKVFEWVKQKALYFIPIVGPAMMLYKVGTSIKDKVTGWFKDTRNKSEKYSKSEDAIESKSATILGRLAEVFGLGYSGVQPEDLERNWRFTGNGAGDGYSENVEDTDAVADGIEDDSIVANVDYSKIEVGDIFTSNVKRFIKRKAVYVAFRRAGFTHNQALVLTSHIGRENGFQTRYLFGNHKDPARGTNMGFMSWQGGREIGLRLLASARGVLAGKWALVPSQTAIDVQAQYVMEEMTGKENYRKGVKQFLASPNITFKEAAPLLGGSGTYVGWARGQARIRDENNNWKKWDWKDQERRQYDHYKAIKQDIESGSDSEVYESAPTSSPSQTDKLKALAPEYKTSPDKTLSKNSRPVIAAAYARKFAHKSSTGYCARYVRRALQYAKYSFTPNAHAYQYHTSGTMASMGFVQISTATPWQVGDVIVANKNGSHVSGHISIWDGRNWVSDFIQSTWKVYSKNMPPVSLWRDAEYLNGAKAASGWSNGLAGQSMSGPSAMGADATTDIPESVSNAVGTVAGAVAAAAATNMSTASLAEWNPGQVMASIFGGAMLGGAVANGAKSAWDDLINKDINGDMASE